MTKEQKAEVVRELGEKLARARLALLASAQGLTVAELTQLRRELREAGGEFRVAKNTLARRAVAGGPYASLSERLLGPNGFVFAYEDPVAVAKVIVRFASAHTAFQVRGGVLEGGAIGPEEVDALAKLPSREVLLAQLLGLLQAPASRLLATIQEPGARLARLLAKLRDRGEEGGNAAGE
ncbi:MAG: 50S ribosomal protein L10 [Candidatus Binatia bacterium]|nr:MAG: 50S ribosomal protein L10 [Candidatus Binatia bacterium]